MCVRTDEHRHAQGIFIHNVLPSALSTAPAQIPKPSAAISASVALDDEGAPPGLLYDCDNSFCLP